MRGDEISQEQHSLRAICMEAVSLIPDGIVVKDGSRLLFEHHLSSAIDIDAFCCGFTPELAPTEVVPYIRLTIEH